MKTNFLSVLVILLIPVTLFAVKEKSFNKNKALAYTLTSPITAPMPSFTAVPISTLTPPTLTPIITTAPTPYLPTPLPTQVPTPTPNIIPPIGLKVDNTSVNLTIARGSQALAYNITSTGADGFTNYGYPTSYGPGINTNPASGGLTVGMSVPVYIQVIPTVPSGTYSGTQIVKNLSNTGGLIIPVTITVIDPTPTPTPSPKPLACKNVGDVDGDKKISMADLDLVMKYDVGLINLSKNQQKRADVNSDKSVNSIDGMLIGQYLNNLISRFPACPKP